MPRCRPSSADRSPGHGHPALRRTAPAGDAGPTVRLRRAQVAVLALVLSTRERTRRPADRGATLVEYALLVALVAVACIAAISLFGASWARSVSRSNSSMFG